MKLKAEQILLFKNTYGRLMLLTLLIQSGKRSLLPFLYPNPAYFFQNWINTNSHYEAIYLLLHSSMNSRTDSHAPPTNTVALSSSLIFSSQPKSDYLRGLILNLILIQLKYNPLPIYSNTCFPDS